MSEIKHTPGPWEVNPLDSESESNLIFASTLASGTRRLVAGTATGADAPANRRLIAAAPELLEALQYALPYLEACVPNPRNGMNADYSIDVNCVDRARSAIAKATGSQS